MRRRIKELMVETLLPTSPRRLMGPHWAKRPDSGARLVRLDGQEAGIYRGREIVRTLRRGPGTRILIGDRRKRRLGSMMVTAQLPPTRDPRPVEGGWRRTVLCVHVFEPGGEG